MEDPRFLGRVMKLEDVKEFKNDTNVKKMKSTKSGKTEDKSVQGPVRYVGQTRYTPLPGGDWGAW